MKICRVTYRLEHKNKFYDVMLTCDRQIASVRQIERVGTPHETSEEIDVTEWAYEGILKQFDVFLLLNKALKKKDLTKQK